MDGHLSIYGTSLTSGKPKWLTKTQEILFYWSNWVLHREIQLESDFGGGFALFVSEIHCLESHHCLHMEIDLALWIVHICVCRNSGFSAPKAREEGESSGFPIISTAGTERAQFQPCTAPQHQSKVLPQLCVWVQPTSEQPFFTRQWQSLFPFYGIWQGLYTQHWKCIWP